MVGWNSIFGDLEPEPVRGHPWSYEAAGSEARQLHSSLEEIELDFSQITSGNLDDLRGATADRLVDLVNEMDGSLADLPAVFDDLDGIFSRHAERLVALRQRTDEGLARAEVRWRALDDARADHIAAVGSLSATVSCGICKTAPTTSRPSAVSRCWNTIVGARNVLLPTVSSGPVTPRRNSNSVVPSTSS